MPASIRIIKIVKDFHGGEAYTIEFECEAENSSDLANELTKSPYGQRVIEMLNESEFLPERPNKTAEELKAEAEKEEKERKDYEDRIKRIGMTIGKNELFAALKEKYGERFVEKFKEWLEEEKKKAEKKKKEEEQAATTKSNNDNTRALGPFSDFRGLNW